MPRISQLSLDQINRQIDTIDSLKQQVADLQNFTNNIGHQVAVSDPTHAPQTTNNLAFTWTGGTATLSWPQGYLKTKNWNAQTTSPVPAKSSAPGQPQFFAIPAGSQVLSPSTYYWIGWDPSHQTMLATTDASQLHSNYNVHIICQLFTGTVGQTGMAGGGGSQGGVDLSGSRYKNF